MIPFKTTPEQVLRLDAITAAMVEAGLDKELVSAADELARHDQGVFDLMALWVGTEDVTERAYIFDDIARSILDYCRTHTFLEDAEPEPPRKLTVPEMLSCAREHLTRDECLFLAQVFLNHSDQVAVHAKTFWGEGTKTPQEVAQWLLAVARGVNRGGSS